MFGEYNIIVFIFLLFSIHHSLKIDKMIGEGAFGVVLKATLINYNNNGSNNINNNNNTNKNIDIHLKNYRNSSEDNFYDKNEKNDGGNNNNDKENKKNNSKNNDDDDGLKEKENLIAVKLLKGSQDFQNF